MVEITEKPISPERVIDKARNDSSGCVVTYIGLIRDYSQGKPVLFFFIIKPNNTSFITILDGIGKQIVINDSQKVSIRVQLCIFEDKIFDFDIFLTYFSFQTSQDWINNC